jgi:GH25 family lysozyme M1 (1,4-beta-N-acetylmuramidase)
MTDLLIPDVSEFQGVIDWPHLGTDVAIVRVCYGDLHVDTYVDANIVGARSRCAARGWYAYLVGGRDPAAQADVFCRVLQAHGGLQTTEFVVVDDEEGSGDQSWRVNAFLARCDATLRTAQPGQEDWWYSGLNFALTHNLPAARGHRWVAAYQAGEPGAVPHDLWQFTDAASVAGIRGPVDCSVYHGAVDAFLALIGGDPAMTLDPNDPIVQQLQSDVAWTKRVVGSAWQFLLRGYDDPAAGQTAPEHDSILLGMKAAIDNASLPPAIDVVALAIALAPHLPPGIDEAKLALDLEAVLPGADAVAVEIALAKALSAWRP